MRLMGQAHLHLLGEAGSGRRAKAPVFSSHLLVLTLAVTLALVSAFPFGCFQHPDAFASSLATADALVDPGAEGGEPAPDPDPDVDKPCIISLGIYDHDTGDALNHANAAGAQDGQAACTPVPDIIIADKGGSRQLDAILTWNDWSQSLNHESVTWSSSNPAVVTVDRSGTMYAQADGDAYVYATVDPALVNTAGIAFTAQCHVIVSQQDDAPYVTGLRIADADGNEIGSAAYLLNEPLETAQAIFSAHVDVRDPLTGRTVTYDTRNGTLPEQTEGAIADLSWHVGDSAIGYVEENGALGGAFRPLRYGIVQLFVTSYAGAGNAPITSSIVVNIQDPEGGVVQDGYFPQETLTVKAYYEQYPPTNFNDDDDPHFVINKEYQMIDLSRLGMVTQAYTALGSGSYYTILGRGVPLSSVLQDAGVNISGVSEIAFGTADHIDRPVSYNFVFGMDRYYYPNIDINQYTEAQQVYPILAFSSVELKNRTIGTAEEYAQLEAGMTEATRYRLLFGSTPDGGTSQYQIKWISTLYIKLSGGPQVEEGEDGDDGSNGTAVGGQVTGGEGNGGGMGTAADGVGLGTEGQGAGAGVSAANAGGSNAASEGDSHSESGISSQASGLLQEVELAEVGRPEGNYAVYQVMNINDSDTPFDLPYQNPFKPFVGPLGVGILVTGAGEALLHYRRQAKGTPFSLVLGAS